MEAISNLYQTQRKSINATFGFVVVLAFWEFGDWQVGSELFFVGPWRVFTFTFELFATGEILNDLKVSGIEFFWGFSIAAGIGIGFGMLFGISRGFREFFDPWLSGPRRRG